MNILPNPEESGSFRISDFSQDEYAALSSGIRYSIKSRYDDIADTARYVMAQGFNRKSPLFASYKSLFNLTFMLQNDHELTVNHWWKRLSPKTREHGEALRQASEYYDRSVLRIAGRPLDRDS